MSFTYTQLKQAIQDYTENDETSFVTNLPVFIRQTEERILKNVQLSLFRKKRIWNDDGFQSIFVVSVGFFISFFVIVCGREQ